MIQKVVSRLFIVAIACVFLQIPFFVEQYAVRLEGHQAESQRQIAAFTEAAAAGGKTLDLYTAKFLEQQDQDFRSQGMVMQKAIERHQFLTRACDALHNAGPFLKPFVFVRYFDSEVVADAWKGFTPGFSLSLSVVVFGVIGLIVGWGITVVTRNLWSSLGSRTP